MELIEASVAQYADNPLFGTLNANGEYEWVTYQQVGDRIDPLRRGLANLGIDKGTDNGLLTQTMKLKRRVVLKRYQFKIEALYTE